MNIDCRFGCANCNPFMVNRSDRDIDPMRKTKAEAKKAAESAATANKAKPTRR